MKNLFVQIHTLTSYSGALLNRDDVGFAKRLPFGGATRTRVSSQCLKRHWRTFEGEHALSELELPRSVRSRETFEHYVRRPLIEGGVEAGLADEVTGLLMKEILGQSAKAKKAADAQEEFGFQTGQITVLGEPELNYILELGKKVAAQAAEAGGAAKAFKEVFDKAEKKNAAAIRMGAGLDAALFGRMVTSDVLARGDAAVHVAHAFTVHEQEVEQDYFSAIDELRRDSGELGSGHIGNTELTSGTFYSYVNVDVGLLVSNLTGCPQSEWTSADRRAAAGVVEHLIKLIATVSPGAKLGSTAPHAYAQAMVVELGSAQPRTLANAFYQPVRSRDGMEGIYEALASHLDDLDQMYGVKTSRQAVGVRGVDRLTEVGIERAASLDAMAAWISSNVRGGQDG